MSKTDCSVKLAQWMGDRLRSPILAFDKPLALAGQNQIWRIQTQDGKRAIVRCGAPHRADCSLSGIAIRGHLAQAGITVPNSLHVSGKGEIEGFGICEIMSVVEGEDLEVVWETLSHVQAMALARSAAGAVKASMIHMSGHPEHPVDGFGLCLWGKPQPSPTWWAWCAQWLGWVTKMGHQRATLDPQHVLRVKTAMWTCRALLDDVTRESAQTFVWDVAERNVMVKDGAWSGLVDQDVVMVGDPLIAPALAWVALQARGVPWAADYKKTWLSSWGMDAQGELKVCLYSALFALQMASKTGRSLPDGRTDPGMSKDGVGFFVGQLQEFQGKIDG